MIGPLDLGSEHSVTIDCRGQAFDYAGVNSRLTMGPGAVLRFQNCLLLDYDLSDSVNPPGSKQRLRGTLPPPAPRVFPPSPRLPTPGRTSLPGSVVSATAGHRHPSSTALPVTMPQPRCNPDIAGLAATSMRHSCARDQRAPALGSPSRHPSR